MQPTEDQWVPYNPQWLIELARERYPAEPWLAAAFAPCTRARSPSKASIYFVHPSHANQPGALWQFDRNMFINSPQEGLIIIDILTNHRVGGIELYDYLVKGPVAA